MSNFNLVNFDLYESISSLAVIFAQFLVGLWKRNLLWSLFLLFFIHCVHLEYSSSGGKDESYKEYSDKLGSESGSAGTFGTGLGGLLRVVGFPLGATLYDYELFDGDGGSLYIP